MNPANLPRLWLYNLHYHNDLISIREGDDFFINSQLINNWIQNNPPNHNNNGWDPYCISLRSINWIKWFSNLDNRKLKQDWVDSLVCQAQVLSKNLEYNILGNHIFSNAKALIFLGVYFGGTKGEYWLKRGLFLLDRELMNSFLQMVHILKSRLCTMPIFCGT